MAFSYRGDKNVGRPASLLRVVEDDEPSEKGGLGRSFEPCSVMDDPMPVVYRKSKSMNRKETASASYVETAENRMERNSTVPNPDESGLHKKNEDWNR